MTEAAAHRTRLERILGVRLALDMPRDGVWPAADALNGD
jgi:hypothetical protein